MDTASATTEHWQFDHLSLVTSSPSDSTATALADLLGLRIGYRPPFPFPGRWFYNGEQAHLHVIDSPTTLAPDAPATVISHIAFRSNVSLKSLLPRLNGTGKPYRVMRVPEEQTVQIFVQLNTDLLIELDIPAYVDDPSPAEYQSPQDAPNHAQ
jgi:hypothetical protein